VKSEAPLSPFTFHFSHLSLTSHLLLFTHLVGSGRFRQRRSAEHAGNVGSGAATGLTVECDPATLGFFGAGSLGDTFDRD
jgi:hypothetical protein